MHITGIYILFVSWGDDQKLQGNVQFKFMLLLVFKSYGDGKLWMVQMRLLDALSSFGSGSTVLNCTGIFLLAIFAIQFFNWIATVYTFFFGLLEKSQLDVALNPLWSSLHWVSVRLKFGPVFCLFLSLGIFLWFIQLFHFCYQWKYTDNSWRTKSIFSCLCLWNQDLSSPKEIYYVVEARTALWKQFIKYFPLPEFSFSCTVLALTCSSKT